MKSVDKARGRSVQCALTAGATGLRSHAACNRIYQPHSRVALRLLHAHGVPELGLGRTPKRAAGHASVPERGRRSEDDGGKVVEQTAAQAGTIHAGRSG